MAKNSSDTTIKFLIYILIFLLVVLFALLIFVIPNIKGYKYQKRDLEILQLKNRKLLDKESNLKRELELFKKDNRELFLLFDKDFKVEEFYDICKKFFVDIKIDKLDDLKDDKFIKYRVSVISKNNSPDDFYRFIDEISKKDIKIKIDFPIELSLKNSKLHIDFDINIYKKMPK
jgi:hypothetical protein